MNVQIERAIKHPATIPVAAGAATALIIGFASGFVLGRRRGRNEMVDLLVEEMEKPTVQAGSGMRVDADELPKLKERWETLPHIPSDAEEGEPEITVISEKVVQPEHLKEESEWDTPSGNEDVTEVCEIEETAELANPRSSVQVNVFSASDEGWDYDAELATRDEKEVYTLHKDEFYSEEMGYSQHTLTYYVVDDIMCNEEDAPIYNYAKTVGAFDWGHGSGDDDVFYVRNTKLETEYEVIRINRSYQSEVLGLDAEPEDDRTVGPRRFREEHYD